MHGNSLGESNCPELQKIEDILLCFCSCSTLKGFEYVKVAISIACEAGDAHGGAINDIYNKTAAIFNTTAICVERNIRTFLDHAWKHCDKDILSVRFPYIWLYNKRALTNKAFILTIAEWLKQNN